MLKGVQEGCHRTRKNQLAPERRVDAVELFAYVVPGVFIDGQPSGQFEGTNAVGGKNRVCDRSEYLICPGAEAGCRRGLKRNHERRCEPCQPVLHRGVLYAGDDEAVTLAAEQSARLDLDPELEAIGVACLADDDHAIDPYVF